MIALVVFSISIPVKIFQPSLIVSIHSVLFLIVIQGIFNKYASFCVPPESVITLLEYLINFIKSKYPNGSVTITFLHFFNSLNKLL